MTEKIPTCGYDDDGKMQVFDLEPGETLPEGWHAAPKPWHHPNNPDFGKAKPSEPKAPEPKAPEPPPTAGLTYAETGGEADSVGLDKKPIRKKK